MSFPNDIRYFKSIYVWSDVRQNIGWGTIICVLYWPSGRVIECSHSNVHIIWDGVFITVLTDELILSGIACVHLNAACEQLRITVREMPYTVDELKSADEIITPSSTAQCVRA